MDGFSIETKEVGMEINLEDYLAWFWRWTWVILLTAVVAGICALIFSSQVTPIYQSTTTVLVNEAPVTRTSDYTSLMASERLTKTYAEIMTTTPVLVETIRRLELNLPPSTLKSMITIKPIINTQLIDVIVESADPVAATMIANTVVEVFSEQIQQVQINRYANSKLSLEAKLSEIETQLNLYTGLAANASSVSDQAEWNTKTSQYREIYFSLLKSYEDIWLSEAQTVSSIAIVEPASVPITPIRPRILLTVVLASMAGFTLASGIVIAKKALDKTLHSPEDVNLHLRLPVLGMIDSFSNKKNHDLQLIAAIQPRSPVTEGFRSLRENIKFAAIDKSLHTLLVTSSEPGEGKSTVAANLAIVFAQSGIDTILLDCDLRRPMLHTYFKINNQYGLSTMLFKQNVPIDESVSHTPFRKLRIIPSGNLPPNPAELLASDRMKILLKYLKENAELIIIDTPPIQAVTDAVSLAAEMDGVILVVQPGSTHISAASQAIEQLKRAKANILGVVLNPLHLKHTHYGYRSEYESVQNSKTKP